MLTIEIRLAVVDLPNQKEYERIRESLANTVLNMFPDEIEFVEGGENIKCSHGFVVPVETSLKFIDYISSQDLTRFIKKPYIGREIDFEFPITIMKSETMCDEFFLKRLNYTIAKKLRSQGYEALYYDGGIFSIKV